MATLTVTATHNYKNETLDPDDPIDQIVFATSSLSIATFFSNQFGIGDNLISPTVAITGDAFRNIIQVDLSATGIFSAAGWTFSNWTDGVVGDTIGITGSTGADTITGSSKRDVIFGAAGADILSGGDGDDDFLYQNAIEAGESVDGGSGNDTLGILIGAHDLTLAGITITSVETILFSGNNTSLIASGTHFGGAGDFTSITGNSSFTQSLTVNGQTVDLSGVTFTNWGGANQTVTINGTNAGANILFGSSQKDTITGTGSSIDAMRGGGAADTLNGGDGNDTFDYVASNDVVSGEVISGGIGTDAITLNNAGSNDFSLATITSVETLDFVSGNSTAIFSGNQIGSGGGVFTLMSGSAGTDALVVNAASNVDLSGLTINTWTNGTDTITINGSASGETLTGTAFNDIITGGDGADTLNGGGGADVFRYTADGQFTGAEAINGGAGLDTVEISAGFHDFTLVGSTLNSIEFLRFTGTASAMISGIDIGTGEIADVIGSAGTDALIVIAASDVNLSGVAFTTWTDGSDTITISGTSSGETITGSSKNDLIVGLDGADTLNGGDGDDAFRYVSSNNAVGVETVNGGNGTDTIQLTFGSDIDFSDDNLSSIETLDFLSAGSTVTLKGTQIGAGAIVTVDGSAGINDLIVNAASDVNLSGVDFTNWTNAGGGGIDTITINGTTAGESLTGSSKNDIINGGGGDDVLNGGAGGDILDGGANTDTVSYASSNAGVAVSLPSQSGVGGHAAGDTLLNIEFLVGSAFEDSFAGTAGVNKFNGGGGDDFLDGGASADWLDGGAGIDTVTYANSNAAVAVSLPSETGVGGDAGGDTLIDIENLIGSAFGDQFLGSSGNNLFDGRAGGDHMDGGAGIDTVTYASSNAGVAVSLPSQSGVGGHATGDTLLNIENLIGSAFDDQFAGTSGVNRLDGGGGNDFLDGDAGGDELIGGSGIDTVTYANSNAAVFISLPSESGIGGHATGDTLLGIENLVGSAFDDQFAGTSGDNLFDGRGGGDHMDGGAGIDTVTYASSNDSVAVSLPSQSGVGGHATGDTLLNIENLIGSAFDDQFAGTSGANRLDGGGGNDFLDGGAGGDELIGGSGIDTVSYANSNAGVAVSLPSESGIGGHATGDTLLGIENLVGSAFDDQFLGTSGANLFDGRGGGDHMDGGAGIDTVTYASSNAGVAVSLPSQSGVGGHAAGDTLLNIENLIGSAFDDQFLGDTGANQFTGGGGNDFFSFNGSFGADVIFDFTAGAGVGDVIQLDDAQFANFAAVLAATADDGFGNTAIYHAAGQIALIGVVKSQLNADDFQFV